MIMVIKEKKIPPKYAFILVSGDEQALFKKAKISLMFEKFLEKKIYRA